MAEEYEIPEDKRKKIRKLAKLVEDFSSDLFYQIPLEHPKGREARREVDIISDTISEVLGKLGIETSPKAGDPVIDFLSRRVE